MQERRDAGKVEVECKKGGMQERWKWNARQEGCRKGGSGMHERRDAGKERFKRWGMQILFWNGTTVIKKIDNFNLKGTAFFSFDVAVSFRFACYMFCFAKYETYETGFRMLKPVSRNTKFREARRIFSRNTKIELHEILENFARKKLECQP